MKQPRIWHEPSFLSWILLPFAVIYTYIVKIRRTILTKFYQQRFPIPIIVIGNLSVGGVGKTPLVIALAQELTQKGIRVGIVSRGYGGQIKQFPHEVSASSTAVEVGDEPFLISKKTACPVVIAPKRAEAVEYLLKKHPIQLVLSDDGLQHYAMGRTLEIVIIDGTRGFGNGRCLPAGPLREKISRLKEVDFIVINEEPPGKRTDFPSNANKMTLIPCEITNLVSGQTVPKTHFHAPVAAVAGIGNPQRFFTTLGQMGLAIQRYPFPDHYPFRKENLVFHEKMVVMTEKDAVKCQSFATDSMYYLPVKARLDDQFWDKFWLCEPIQGILAKNAPNISAC